MLRKQKELARNRRKKRTRNKVRGTSDRPRLTIFKSSRHIYAQVIDDSKGNTLAAASTLSPELKKKRAKEKKVEVAKWVGTLIAEKALAHRIKMVIFDRNGFLYHGRVRALAEAAREKGLEF